MGKARRRKAPSLKWSCGISVLLVSGGFLSTSGTASALVTEKCHGYQLTAGTYGEPSSSSSSAGAAAFAPLVGVACGESCYREALAWYGEGVLVDKHIMHPSECEELCQQLSDCEVFTWKKSEFKCEFKKATTWASPMWTEDSGYDSFSAPRDCGVKWMTPFDGLRKGDGEETCYAAGKSFGEAEGGACADLETLEVSGQSDLLAFGTAQGWWPSNATTSGVSVMNATSCQERCESGVVPGACAGFTFSFGENLSQGLCVLKGKLPTNAAGAVPQTCGLETSSLLGVSPPTVAGVPNACVGDVEEVDPFFADCDTPRCKEPHNEGEFVDGWVYAPKGTKCSYHVASTEDHLKCLEGSWILVSGGSNAILTYLNWINTIKPGHLHTQREDMRTFYVDMVDIVFDLNGEIVFENRKLWSQMTTFEEYMSGDYDQFQGAITETMRSRLVREWDEATYTDKNGKQSTEGLVRITLVIGQFWQNTAQAWSAMNDLTTPWKGANKTLWAQIMIWYLVCGLWDIYFCTQPAYRGLGAAKTVAVYKRDFENFLASAQSQCEASLGCFISPQLYQMEAMSVLPAMMEDVKTAISNLGSSKIKWLDVFSISTLKPMEIVDNHWTPAMHLWVVTILLNSICEYKEHDVGCPQQVTFTKGCTAGNLEDLECSECQCPLYKEMCAKNTDGCKNWECLNSRSCSVGARAISSDTRVRNASDAACRPDIHVDTSHPPRGTGARRRVWQGSAGDAWLLCSLVSVAAILILFGKEFKRRKWMMRKPPSKLEGTTAQNPDSAAEAKKPTHYLGALGFARFIASVHIVVGHLYAKGALKNPIHMFQYGFSWVPWFFMLSGFVLTHARLTSRDPSKVDDTLTFVWKRLANIFPMYAVGVLIAALIRVAQSKTLPQTWILVLQSWLLQSFIPMATERALQVHCWFLSCMVAYWVSFKPLYTAVVKEMRLKQTLLALFALALVPWLASMVMPPLIGEPLLWYKEHRTGAVDNAVDIWTVFIKFNPLCYWHVFAFGMLLSRLRILILEDHRSHLMEKLPLLWRAVQCGCASVGYAGLLLVMNVGEIQPPAHKISTRLSILMPLQGLVLLGLSFEGDPVARAFKSIPKVVGDSSYPQYVLQFVAYEVWPTETIRDPSFFIFLTSVAIISAKAIQENARRLWMLARASAVISPALLMVVMVALSELYKPRSSGEGSYPALPVHVNTTRGKYIAVDMRLNFQRYPPGGDGGLAVINPSLAVVKGKLVLVARLHGITEEKRKNVQWEGKSVTEIVTRWYSSLVVGHNAMDAGSWLGWDAGSWNLSDFKVEDLALVSNVTEPHRSRWGSLHDPRFGPLCEPEPVYIPSNNTLIRKVVTGPEDPKLLSLGAATFLTFNSLLPPNLAITAQCHQTRYGVQQMFLSSPYDPTAVESGTLPHAVRLKCGSETRDEKNWIGFQYGDQLLYVYSVYPHKVLQVRKEDGACVEKWSTADYLPLFQASLAAEADIHGSGSATLVSNPDGDDYYLALLHYLTRKERVYTSLAYKFEAKPPFKVLGVSKPLPLQGSTRAFASSLLVLPEQGKVVIGYGVANAEARALVMDVRDLEALFECSKETT
ncbi:hypothetical protein A3770_06p40730 [Chloropicon primus]|uniref:Apple domain-containing protein n=2 Tax=Chloropicon primus TaxID=1764295 RepID=A0A5B8MPN4_9CHLO|nr:hypothetical protein A3770_06p40730 [Chloropicon primus]|eukprot:QDZ21555.1 hypothetical protein A3770_06p40730 [Chloropicon primus]